MTVDDLARLNTKPAMPGRVETAALPARQCATNEKETIMSRNLPTDAPQRKTNRPSRRAGGGRAVTVAAATGAMILASAGAVSAQQTPAVPGPPSHTAGLDVVPCNTWGHVGVWNNQGEHCFDGWGSRTVYLDTVRRVCSGNKNLAFRISWRGGGPALHTIPVWTCQDYIDGVVTELITH
ncbi:hypothetical protein [Amycolatopsis sp. EV170708-02-1]|uniref:hypothetical protein n=1 Tax=Amycolatopsis sp. EV170708-02-1 TaxID=2919322 RepID=UPI001F0C0BDF|nr:hypothetical protein [Amycolatopsis sp. EV170708-02-1]UMP00098.1 hypothetical protein MJQ72_26745 [Amycolatopsis sp. EV170708-02-1]